MKRKAFFSILGVFISVIFYVLEIKTYALTVDVFSNIAKGTDFTVKYYATTSLDTQVQVMAHRQSIYIDGRLYTDYEDVKYNCKYLLSQYLIPYEVCMDTIVSSNTIHLVGNDKLSPVYYVPTSANQYIN